MIGGVFGELCQLVALGWRFRFSAGSLQDRGQLVRPPPPPLPAGALMLVGWMTTVSVGVIVARFFKPVLSRPLFGEAAWFQVGRGERFMRFPCCWNVAA